MSLYISERARVWFYVAGQLYWAICGQEYYMYLRFVAQRAASKTKTLLKERGCFSHFLPHIHGGHTQTRYRSIAKRHTGKPCIRMTLLFHPFITISFFFFWFLLMIFCSFDLGLIDEWVDWKMAYFVPLINEQKCKTWKQFLSTFCCKSFFLRCFHEKALKNTLSLKCQLHGSALLPPL